MMVGKGERKKKVRMLLCVVRLYRCIIVLVSGGASFLDLVDRVYVKCRSSGNCSCVVVRRVNLATSTNT